MTSVMGLILVTIVFLLPQPSKSNFLGTFLPLFMLIRVEASCNADLFCFAASLPPFQLLFAPVSLKLILLAVIGFNGPIQLFLCVREILLVTVVAAELGPKHLLDFRQIFPDTQ